MYVIIFQKKRITTWTKWTDDQLAAVNRAFYQYIKQGVHPPRAQIRKVKENFPVLKDITEVRISSQVKNLTTKNKSKELLHL